MIHYTGWRCPECNHWENTSDGLVVIICTICYLKDSKIIPLEVESYDDGTGSNNHATFDLGG